MRRNRWRACCTQQGFLLWRLPALDRGHLVVLQPLHRVTDRYQDPTSPDPGVQGGARLVADPVVEIAAGEDQDIELREVDLAQGREVDTIVGKRDLLVEE